MNVTELVSCLEYADSPFYLSGSRLDDCPGYSHVFRRAKEKCSLRGVYALRRKDKNHPANETVIPMVYVCEATSEAEAAKFHKLVWNQNVVPFLLVSTPKTFRLYPGFKYNTTLGMAKDQSILEIAKTANEVLENLSDFKASSIDNGVIWKNREKEVSQETRVDRNLLRSLRDLGDWLHRHDLSRSTAHALIGKYVYLHYLKDRGILSKRKLEQWGIEPESVFGRMASESGFDAVNARLEEWLNGSIFPIPRRGDNAPKPEHIQKVASTFRGDDPASDQMHLDFRAYDFEQIPIETLSMVYQQFLHAEGRGRGQGAYYTPIHLVNFILDELDAKRPLQKGMRVFDAACGSGAFLVQCYRRLIEREFAQGSGKSLQPSELRNLLTNHIYGLDVDEDACGVTELSLVLTLLDYVDPPDLEKPCYNKFKLPALRNQNIFHCKEGFFDPKSEWQKAKPKAGYDWIVGNPPWKKLNSKKLEKGDRAALDWIRNNKTQYPTSDNQLAEAFAWEVTQYLSNQGLVGLLMPAATLFKTKAVSFRKQFFDQMDAWCVVNFANLRHLLFQGAVNPAAAFFYSIPQESKKEKNLRIRTYAPFAVSQLTRYEANNRGRKKLWTIIVNADEIREIPQNDAASGSSQPWKLAMWGSLRDRHLLVSLAKHFDPLSKFAKKHGLAIHEGLQLRTKDANEPVQPIQEVEGQRELDMSVLRGCDKIFVFPEDALTPIEAARTYVRKGRGTKPLEICYPPHIVVDAARRFAVFSNEFIVVPSRQIGIAGSSEDVNLLKALALYLNSDFAVYHQFLTSTFWGIERDRLDKNDLENLPIPLDSLSAKEFAHWASLHDKLVKATSSDLQKSKSSLFGAPQETLDAKPLLKQLNKAVYALLNIDRTERWLIQDLLYVRIRLNEGRLAEEATTIPDKSEIQAYASALKMELDDFLDSDIKDQHRVTVYYTNQSAIVKIEHPRNPPAGPASVVKVEDPMTEKEFNKLRSNLLREQGQWIYFNRNLKIFTGRTTYFVKPSQRLNWLKSQALLDADEFIAEKLTLTGDE